MAKVFGSSAAFLAVRMRARQIDSTIQLTDLNSLRDCIAERQESLKGRLPTVVNQVIEEASELRAKSEQLDRAVEYHQASRLAEAKDAQSRALESAAMLHSQPAWLLKRLWNHVKAWKQISTAGNRVRRVEDSIRGMRLSSQGYLRRAVAFEDDPMKEAERRLWTLRRMIEDLEVLLDSPDARGAVGELAVASELQKLSDEFTVFHDVRLQAELFMKFDGKPVMSAQVDHMVVGPTGIFVIETKSWSRDSVQDGDYFDPYEQVGRAGLLCHCLLKDAGLPSRTRTVIASHNRVRETRLKRFTQAVKPNRLSRYILRSRITLSECETERVARYIQSSVT